MLTEVYIKLIEAMAVLPMDGRVRTGGHLWEV